MYIHDIVGENESHPVYRELERTNVIRQYNFLDSIISTSLNIKHYSISEELIASLNFHAIACLHKGAGMYREIPVSVGEFNPPQFEEIPRLMNELVSFTNDAWKETHPIALASYVMWGINHIHPFVNGNGRTARAMFYYVFCLKLKAKLGIQLPELIRTQHRAAYVKALQEVDETIEDTLDISPLANLMERIIIEAIRTQIKPG